MLDLFHPTLAVQRFAKGRTFLVATGTQATWLQQMHPHATLKSTIQGAHDDAENGRGDLVIVGGQTFDETLAITKNDLTFVGSIFGTMPTSIIARTVNDAACLTLAVGVRRVAFFNIGFEPTLATATKFGIQVLGKDIYFHGCKFAGNGSTPGIAMEIGGGATNGAARVRIWDSEFEFCAKHILFRVATGTGNLNTQIDIQRNLFHDASVNCLANAPEDVGGSVQDSFIIGNKFCRNEGGVEPTKYVDLNTAANKNDYQDNSFATANFTSAKVLIGANSEWVGNKSRAGISTALPS